MRLFPRSLRAHVVLSTLLGTPIGVARQPQHDITIDNEVKVRISSEQTYMHYLLHDQILPTIPVVPPWPYGPRHCTSEACRSVSDKSHTKTSTARFDNKDTAHATQLRTD